MASFLPAPRSVSAMPIGPAQSFMPAPQQSPGFAPSPQTALPAMLQKLQSMRQAGYTPMQDRFRMALPAMLGALGRGIASGNMGNAASAFPSLMQARMASYRQQQDDEMAWQMKMMEYQERQAKRQALADMFARNGQEEQARMAMTGWYDGELELGLKEARRGAGGVSDLQDSDLSDSRKAEIADLRMDYESLVDSLERYTSLIEREGMTIMGPEAAEAEALRSNIKGLYVRLRKAGTNFTENEEKMIDGILGPDPTSVLEGISQGFGTLMGQPSIGETLRTKAKESEDFYGQRLNKLERESGVRPTERHDMSGVDYIWTAPGRITRTS